MSHSTALGQVLRFPAHPMPDLPCPCQQVTGNRIWVAGGQRAWGGRVWRWGPGCRSSLLFMAGAKGKKRKRNLAIKTSKPDQMPLSAPAL